MTAAAKSFLLPEEDQELRRWLICAVIVIAVHAGFLFWLMHRRDIEAAGAPPAVVMMDLPPMDVAPASEVSPDAVEGPKMTEAQPEQVETPEAMPVPELRPAQKPAAVLLPPPKPKAKPKKILKPIPKPVVKRVHEPPAPRTSAPPRAATAAARAASSRAASSAAAAASRTACAAGLGNLNRHYPEAARARGVEGTVRLALVIDRSGRVQSARIMGSSGSSELDQAALQMARNASCPPMETSANFTLPVHFHIR